MKRPSGNTLKIIKKRSEWDSFPAKLRTKHRQSLRNERFWWQTAVRVKRRLRVRRWNEVKKSHNLQPVFLLLLQASWFTRNVEVRGHTSRLPSPWAPLLHTFTFPVMLLCSLREFVWRLNSPHTSEQRERRCMSMTALRLLLAGRIMTLGGKERSRACGRRWRDNKVHLLQ